MATKWAFGGFDFIAQGADPESLSTQVPGRLEETLVPGKPGSLAQSVPLSASVLIRLAGTIIAASPAARRTVVDALTKEIRKGRAKLYTYYDDRHIWAIPGVHRFEEIRGTGLKRLAFEIPFTCDDPFWTSDTLDTNIYTADGSTQVLAAGGDAMSPPVITVTAPVAGLTRFDAANNTASKTFRWDGSLASGQILEIDMAAGTIKENGTLTMAGMHSTAVFWDLETGNNSLVFTSTATLASLTLTKRARWYP